MFGGWFIGDFTPSVHKDKNFEVGVKFYSRGDTEPAHYQKTAIEVTTILDGEVRIGSHFLSKGEILSIFPEEIADFEALTDCTLVVVKFPSLPDDKVVV